MLFILPEDSEIIFKFFKSILTVLFELLAF